MKIAYLVNVYPAVSHSFIRREILALEALGHCVHRFSIRPSARVLPDALDQREQARTTVVLGGSKLSLVLAGARWALTRPARFVRAWHRAGRMVDGGKQRAMRRLAYLLEGCWLATRLRSLGVDHLHVHFGTNPAAVARVIHILSAIPYSITVHGPDEFDAPLAIDLPGKIADACFVAGVSEFGRSQLCRWVPLDQWRKLVVRCGLDIDRAVPAASAPARDIDICTVARLAPQKGLPILLSAIARLQERGLRVSASLVGDGPLRPELERQAQALGIGPQIAFLGDCDGATVMAMLGRSKIMVLPSFAEGLPVVIMEAFACRTPVVTTLIAGIPGKLVDESCGWLVPAGSSDHLADAIADALSITQADRDARAERGRDRVLERHDVAASASAIARLIERGGA